MIKINIDNLIEELRTSPYTMIVLAGLVAYSIWGVNTYARAGRVDALHAKIERIFLLQTAQAIHTVAEQLCSEDNKLSYNNLQRLLDGYQADYKAMESVYYPVPACT